MRSLALPSLGHGLAVATVVAMAVQAVVVWSADQPEAHDLWGYALIIGVPTLVFAVVGWRGGPQAGWGYLVAAFGTALAAGRGLTTHWLYVAVFLLAVVITQLVPVWQHDRAQRRRSASTSGVAAFREMGDRDLQQGRESSRSDT